MKNNLHSPVFSLKNKLMRISWFVFYILFFRFTPIPFFGIRRLLLSFFGAKIAPGVRIYPSCKIWIPCNLVVGVNSTIGPFVNVYNQGAVTIGERTIISQGVHICASTHDYNDPVHPLILAPIVIESDVWVCADAFIGPGCHLSSGSVIGARAVVSKTTESWSVYAGNPARKVKERVNFSNNIDVRQ